MSLLSLSLSILPQVSVSRATSEFDSPEIEFLLCFMVSCPILSPCFTLSNLSLLSLSGVCGFLVTLMLGAVYQLLDPGPSLSSLQCLT